MLLEITTWLSTAGHLSLVGYVDYRQLFPVKTKHQISKQDWLSRSVNRRKQRVFERSRSNVEGVLQGRSYDSFPVETVAIPAGTKHTYADERNAEILTDAKKNTIRANDELKVLAREVQFINDHAVQRRYQIEFIKCEDRQCQHCSSHPVQSRQLMTFLRHQKYGCALQPKLSAVHQGHYDTWIQVAASSLEGEEVVSFDLDHGSQRLPVWRRNDVHMTAVGRCFRAKQIALTIWDWCTSWEFLFTNECQMKARIPIPPTNKRSRFRTTKSQKRDDQCQ